MISLRGALKIFIPICIGLAIFGMYEEKNSSSASATAATAKAEGSQPAQNLAGADFSFILKEKPNLKEYAKYGLPVIIDYGADYCPPCRKFYPIMEKANKQYQGKAFLKYIDTEKTPQAVGKVPIQYIPTQLFYDKAGKPFKPSSELKQKIEFSFFKSKKTNETLYTAHVGPLSEAELKAILKEMGVK